MDAPVLASNAYFKSCWPNSITKKMWSHCSNCNSMSSLAYLGRRTSYNLIVNTLSLMWLSYLRIDISLIMYLTWSRSSTSISTFLTATICWVSLCLALITYPPVPYPSTWSSLYSLVTYFQLPSSFELVFWVYSMSKI